LGSLLQLGPGSKPKVRIRHLEALRSSIFEPDLEGSQPWRASE
jgi:hypothetical protein